ncbi:RagB/SusD family nutrient uptake outer membrane protein [Pedobacter nyackensis]|uniref:Starch-binding associating with outer membrane n=1 Tax=Pedobacter nyackensis TaxID=475255 RepID=A0A1W2F2B3_9SPHI|nr:RagB/SusD family nutrient uptake outer membrane protein [Pedobacter nyackensis]SMD16051.1 Starch-binding associating with outer membrane [Pedobacter nyackensis]
MKKLILLSFIFIATVGLISCSKSFLDEKSDSSYSPANSFKNVAGLEAGIAGLQASVREQYTMQVTQSLLCIFQVGTDVAIAGQENPESIPYHDYSRLLPVDEAARSYWTWAYKVITNTNQILRGTADPSAVLTDAQRKLYTAEARFFRAYAYNFLVTLWGEVPLLDRPYDEPKTDFTRASIADLNKFINDDLLYATANLPAIDQVSKPGRISKEAASQLFAEVYLRQGKNDLAEAQCLAVIAGNFKLVDTRYGVKKSEAGDPFADMFIYGNQRRRQGNTEAIWVQELEFNIPGGATNLDQHRRVWVAGYDTKAGMLVADSLGGRGVGRLRLSPWVIKSLYTGTGVNDMRNSKYNLRRDFYYNDPKNVNFGKKVIPLPADTLFRIVPYTTKWNHFIASDPNGAGAFKDLIMMRLGETYLLLAEAQFKQNRPDDAAISINKLRTRANAAQVTGADITLDFLLDERARELIGEENRRMTLVRTGTLLSRVQRLNIKENTTIKPYNVLLPIPQTEIDLNKDAKLGQNLGYN